MARFFGFVLAVALLVGMVPAIDAGHGSGQVFFYNGTNHYVTVTGHGLGCNDNICYPTVVVPPKCVNPNPIEYGCVPAGHYKFSASNGGHASATVHVHGHTTLIYK